MKTVKCGNCNKELDYKKDMWSYYGKNRYLCMKCADKFHSKKAEINFNFSEVKSCSEMLKN